MRLKEPFVPRKHIHSWRLAHVEYGTLKHAVERVCSECNLRQEGRLTHELYDSLPESWVHLADVDWRNV